MVEFLREDLSRKVESLSDKGLEHLMDNLLTEEERLCEVVEGSDHGKTCDKDGGCDYWTYPVSKPSRWLGQHEACWQFKSIAKLPPEFLKKEIKKEYPQEALENGGRYVFVASKKAVENKKIGF